MLYPITTPGSPLVCNTEAGPAPNLSAHGLHHSAAVHANLSPATLTELAVTRGEGFLSDRGALVASTGERTGRSPQDRYVVIEPERHDLIAWGAANRALAPELSLRLQQRVEAYLQNRELFVFDGWACADPRHRLAVRVVAERAWHALFAHCLLLRPTVEERRDFQPQLTILHAADMRAEPTIDGTRSGTFVVLDLARNVVLAGGTHYAGEIKKAVFSYLNYLLPERGVLPMHCAANIGPAGDTALFFGLSGTGKTTLSADPGRRLIGDDEHGWSDEGVFNIEGGCYAKCIRLSRAGEPQIWEAIRFGCVLENVAVDQHTRQPDYDDDRFTENTRAAYPVDYIPGCELSGRGGHPSNVLFLTCDAFGVLPPLAKLTPELAMYHFLSGYTAKVAGTETGVKAPQATFSTCFAAPFLPLPPTRYAKMLEEQLRRHRADVWLVNTGWTGGPAGVGNRIDLAQTRAMVRAILAGTLANVPCVPEPVFGLPVPASCPGVAAEVLQPRSTWADARAYDVQARTLAVRFHENFSAYTADVPEAVRQVGPRV